MKTPNVPDDCRFGCQGTHTAEHELRRDLAGMSNAVNNLTSRLNREGEAYARLHAKLAAVETERDALRAALEKIAYTVTQIDVAEIALAALDGAR